MGKVQVKAGGSTTLELDFRIGSEFHINSNKPQSELLIPTVLKLSPHESGDRGCREVSRRAGHVISLLAGRKAERVQRRLHHYGGD